MVSPFIFFWLLAYCGCTLAYCLSRRGWRRSLFSFLAVTSSLWVWIVGVWLLDFGSDFKTREEWAWIGGLAHMAFLAPVWISAILYNFGCKIANVKS